MRPRSQNENDQLDLFRAHFDQILNPDHPLVVLARKIDWKRFDTALADCYCPDIGAPAKAIRLLVGLHYLKHAFNLSDEAILARWIENPYWQYFCGFTTMQHELPLHPTSLVKWRKRVGVEKLVELLQETIALAVREKQVSPQELKQVNVDTTVQEKNITHPTDAYVDKGYRGHDYAGDAMIHIAGASNRGQSRTTRKRRRRRSAVEPIIGHMKSDHRMDRCFLKGLLGDAINAILSAAGLNLRKLLRWFVFALISWLSCLGNLRSLTFYHPTSSPLAA